ncbi:MAG: ATP-dependent DNA helicase RecQ [Myxococcales bacterium]|nr:ATP-dependent DNA helicase RecQ [Myxococcales bacterium]
MPAALPVPEPAPAGDALRAALEAHFGFSEFHKGQREVIEDVLGGQPTLAIMPTGAGKSLCYQLPALLLDGVTVVVSPLIALMKDQVDALQAKGIAAAYINSSQSTEQQRATIERLAGGDLKLVYVAPERFRHGAFVRALQRADIALFAVDEAHCISRWGHDFRPDYTRLGDVIDRLSPPRVLACTATATPEVRTDILQALHLPDASGHVAGFLRPNLFLEARLCQGDKDRERRLVRFLRSEEGQSGAVIVYASTRKRVERYAAVVGQALGPKHVVAYHGGMGDEDRHTAQERFMSGAARVAVATNAFGMGVDRADVRAVVHVDLPRTVEGYYQEVGRAGRDREPARCLLLYNPYDTRVHEFLIDRSHPPPDALAGVWQALRGFPPEQPVSLAELERAVTSAGHDGVVETCLRRLMRVDAVQFDGYGGFRAHPMAPAEVHSLGIDFAAIETHREHELGKLSLMRRFVHHPGCRHSFVLDYFGEAMDGACPGCDRCSGDGVGGVPGIEFSEPTDEEALVLRKALAGVARAEGRFGARKVAAMLAGSQTKDLQRTPLPRLSTFGILKGLHPDRAVELLNLLVDQRLCMLTSGKYPLIQLTERGWSVMQGREGAGFRPPPHLVPGALPARRAEMLRRGTAAVDHGAQADDQVVEALRRFRTDQARERGVPPYVIFNDKSMCALAAQLPSDEAEFMALPGLGPGKWADFGDAVVELLAPYRG